MPCRLIFHKGNILALNRLRNDCRRLSLCLSRLFERCVNFIEIISVNIDYVKIKCLKLLINRIRGIHLVDWTVNLEIIVIHDDHKVIKLPVRRKHGRLPYLPFLNLTVSK